MIEGSLILIFLDLELNLAQLARAGKLVDIFIIKY